MGIPTNLGNRTFAMRIWLNPERMRAYQVSVEDVMTALAEQSIIGSPGRLGQATGMTSQSKEYVLTYVGRYNKPEQYGNIVIKAKSNGEILRLKEVCVPPADQDSPWLPTGQNVADPKADDKTDRQRPQHTRSPLTQLILTQVPSPNTRVSNSVPNSSTSTPTWTGIPPRPSCSNRHRAPTQRKSSPRSNARSRK